MSGHSMGGTSSVLAAAERRDQVSGLVLFDPVIWTHAWVIGPSSSRSCAPCLDAFPSPRGALRRRRLFDSREQALAAYRGRGAFKGWPEMMLADYISDGLIETDQGFTLACAPEWEASNYASQSHDPWKALIRLQRPVRILKAERTRPAASARTPAVS
jgi:pimeloyl-ACP methyl ester carboxylesterase